MPRGDGRSLVLWSWIVLALLAAHDVTHVLDDGLETPLARFPLVAVPQWIALGIVMAVVVRGDRAQSQLAALLLGIGVTVGVVVVHLLPITSAALWGVRPSVVSWVLVWASVAAGFLLAVLARPPMPAVRRAQAG
jgi:hypothetical protein